MRTLLVLRRLVCVAAATAFLLALVAATATDDVHFLRHLRSNATTPKMVTPTAAGLHYCRYTTAFAKMDSCYTLYDLDDFMHFLRIKPPSACSAVLHLTISKTYTRIYTLYIRWMLLTSTHCSTHFKTTRKHLYIL